MHSGDPVRRTSGPRRQTVRMPETSGGVGTKGVPRADREQQILDAAVHEFGERGYAHWSMAAIAQRAGISKPLIYEYFGSKEGLYLACLRRAGTHLVDRIAEVQKGTTLRRAGDTLAAIFRALDGRRLDWAVIFDPTLPAGVSRPRRGSQLPGTAAPAGCGGNPRGARQLRPD